MALTRWLPLSGLVSVTLIIISVVGLGGSTPDEGASAAKVQSFYGDGPARQYVATFLLAAAAPFVVAFAVRLAATSWPTDHRRPIWELILVGGGVLFAGAILGTAFVHFALTAAGDKGVSGDAIRILNILDADSWVLFNPALGVMMLGAAGVLLTHVTTTRWMGWAALILGIALFVPFADFFALLLSGVWIVVESVMLYRQSPTATALSAAPA
jgi:hypothetical protein